MSQTITSNTPTITIIKNESRLENQMNQLSIQNRSKYLQDSLDDALVIAMKGQENRAFCFKIEEYLNEFMKSNKTTDKITGLDKFQRKIVHKICEIYHIKREHVDVRNDEKGDITFSKTELSKIPEKSLESCFRKYNEEKTKTNKKSQPTSIPTAAPSKILIVKKTDNTIKNPEQANESLQCPKNPESGSAGAKQQNERDSQAQQKNRENNQEYNSASEKRIKEYEEARKKIFDSGEPETATEVGQTQKMAKKKVINNPDSYDPAFDRVRTSSHVQKNIKNDIEPVLNTNNQIPMPYMIMFPQIGGMGMNPYPTPYPMMNQQYPGNMIRGGYPQPYAMNFNNPYTGSLGKLLNPENLSGKKGNQIHL